MDQPVNPPSKGHITWYEGYEYFLTNATTLAHAPAEMPLDSDGYRIGAFVLARTYEDVREQISYIEDAKVKAFLAAYSEVDPDPLTLAWLAIGARDQAQAEAYLGFGAKIMDSIVCANGRYVALVRIDRKNAEWMAGRFASGMLGNGHWYALESRGRDEMARLVEVHTPLVVNQFT